VIIPDRAVSVYVNQRTSSRERRPGGVLWPTLRHFSPLSGSFAQPQPRERRYDMSFFDEIVPPGPGWTRASRLGVGRQRARVIALLCRGLQSGRAVRAFCFRLLSIVVPAAAEGMNR
jgi:hypothetical protein